MTFGSTARNINLLTLSITMCVIAGLFNTSMFTFGNIIIMLISFYVFNILGVWMTLHRYYSHKSFEFYHPFLKYVFTTIAILAGRGSILGWVYLHRQHHAYSDTIKDPHSPKHLGYKLFGFGHYKKQEEHKMQIFLVKDIMTKFNVFIHKWYILLLVGCMTIFASINLELFYFVWILPSFLIQLSQSNFNYFGHLYGYTNHAINDNSKNNVFLFPLILGEAWHNNHHADPKNYSTTVRPFEIDPLTWIIKLVSIDK